MFSSLSQVVGEFLDYATTTNESFDIDTLSSALSTYEGLFSQCFGDAFSESLFPTLEGGAYPEIGLAGVYPPRRAGQAAIATEGESRAPGTLLGTFYAEAGSYAGVQPASVTRLAATLPKILPEPPPGAGEADDQGPDQGPDQDGAGGTLAESGGYRGWRHKAATVPANSALERPLAGRESVASERGGGLSRTVLSPKSVTAPYNVVGDKPASAGAGGASGLKLSRFQRSGRRGQAGQTAPLPQLSEGSGGRLAGQADQARQTRLFRQPRQPRSRASDGQAGTPTSDFSRDLSHDLTGDRANTPVGRGPLEVSPPALVEAAGATIAAAWRGYAARETFQAWRRAARVIQAAFLQRAVRDTFARAREEWSREILAGAMEVQATLRGSVGRAFARRRRASAAYDSFMFMHTKATVPLRSGFLPFTLEPAERVYFQTSSTGPASRAAEALLPIVLQSPPAAFSSGRAELLHAASTPEMSLSSSTLRTLSYLCDPSVAHLIVVCQHLPKMNYYLQNLATALDEPVADVAKRLTVVVPEAFEALGVMAAPQTADSAPSCRTLAYTGAIQTLLLSSPKALARIESVCHEQRYIHRNLIPFYLPTPGCYSSSENMRLAQLVWKTGIPVLGPLGPELGGYSGGGFPEATLNLSLSGVPGAEPPQGAARASRPAASGPGALTDALAPRGAVLRYSLFDADAEFFGQQERLGRTLLAVPRVSQPLSLASRETAPPWHYHDFSGVPTFGSVACPGISGMESYLVLPQQGRRGGTVGQGSRTSGPRQGSSSMARGSWETASLRTTPRTPDTLRITRSSALSWGPEGPVPAHLVPVLPLTDVSRPSRRIAAEIVKAFESRSYEILSLARDVESTEVVSVIVSIDPQSGGGAVRGNPPGSVEGRASPGDRADQSGGQPDARRDSGEVETSVTVLGTCRHISEPLLGTPFPGRTLGYIMPAGDPARLKKEIYPLLLQLVGCGVIGLVTFSFLVVRQGGEEAFYPVETAFGATPPYEHLMVALSQCRLSWNSASGEIIRYFRVSALTGDGRPAKTEDLYSSANVVSPEAVAALGGEGWTREAYHVLSLPFLWHEGLRTAPPKELLLLLMQNALGFDQKEREGLLFDWNSGSLSLGCVGVRRDERALLGDARRLCHMLLKRLDAGRPLVPDSLALESAWNGEAYAARRMECVRSNLPALEAALAALGARGE